jgi:hypothetical protein
MRGRALSLLVLVLPAIAAAGGAEDVQAAVHKEASTGLVVGHASGRLPQRIDPLWLLLQDAIHGRMSENTRVCLFVADGDVTRTLSAMPSQRLPLDEAGEAGWFSGLLGVGTHHNTPVPPGGWGQRNALRKLDIPIPFVADRWFLARETFDATHADKYVMRVEGVAGNIGHYDATWTLTARSPGTLVEIDIRSDLDFTVPSALAGLGASELRGSVERFAEIAAAELP